MRTPQQQFAALLLALVACPAGAIETGSLDPSFGQNGTVNINTLTGAAFAFCPVVARQQDVGLSRLVLGCNLDGVTAVVGLRDNGTLDPQFGDAGISVLPTILWNQNAAIRAISANAEITLVQVPASTSTIGLCGNRSLITRLDRNGRQVAGYGGFSFGYRIFELEPAGSSALSCFPALGGESVNIATSQSSFSLTLPVGPVDLRPALVSLNQLGGLQTPFQSVRRLGEFSIVSAIVPVGNVTYVAGLNAQDSVQLRAYNGSGDAMDSFGGTGSVQLPSSGGFTISLPMMILQPSEGLSSKLLVVSGFDAPPQRGLLVSRYWPNGALDTTFGGTSGNPPGRVLIPDSIFSDPQFVNFGKSFLDSSGRIVVVATSGNTLSAQAVAARLLPDGRLDPAFQSGTQPGVVQLTRQNSDSYPMAGLVMGDKLVYLETWANGVQQQQSVSRLTGNQIIFVDGFEAP